MKYATKLLLFEEVKSNGSWFEIFLLGTQWIHLVIHSVVFLSNYLHVLHINQYMLWNA